MKKLLYITDQQEYSDHGSIGPIFNRYLSQFMYVKIVFFSKFKKEFQDKISHFVLPEHDKKDVLGSLLNSGINLQEYDYIFVRNMESVLKDVLLHKDELGCKVGYRVSIPKKAEEFEKNTTDQRLTLLESIEEQIGDFDKSSIINKCDIFLPTSKELQDTFFHDVTIPSFALPPGIDPKKIKSKETIDDEKKYFIYAGTIDKVRNFEVVLSAFESLQREDWMLKISTPNPAFTTKLLQDFPNVLKKVKFCRAQNIQGVLNQIALSDIGISLLPDIDIYNTATPSKIMDYYTCGVPTLMTNNSKNSSIFKDSEDAWFSPFDSSSIASKIESILDMPKSTINSLGLMGQQKLLQVRNYQTMAQGLFEALEKL